MIEDKEDGRGERENTKRTIEDNMEYQLASLRAEVEVLKRVRDVDGPQDGPPPKSAKQDSDAPEVDHR